MNNTWLRFKTWFLMMWSFIKKYWSLFAMGISMIMGTVVFYQGKQNVKDLLKQQEQTSIQHRQELAELQRIRDEEIARRETIERNYQTTIARINSEHDAAIQRLARAKETEIRQIIAETNDDPAVMASRINALLGIPVMVTP